VRHHRLRGAAALPSHHDRGPEAARIPRLRLGGRGGADPRGTAGHQGRRQDPRAGGAPPEGGCGRYGRHRAHPLGHARRAQRHERPSAHGHLRAARPGAQRHHRELRGAQGGAEGRGPGVHHRDRHRGARPPDREVPGARSQARAGGGQGARRRRRHLRHRGDVRGRAGHRGGSAQGQPAGGGGRGRRVLPGLGRGAAGGSHAAGRLPGRRRDGGAHARGVPHRDHHGGTHRQGRARSGVGPDPDREGRLPAFHAEGDLRAAHLGAELDARPARREGGPGAAARSQPGGRGAARDPAAHHPGLRDFVARGPGRRVPAGGARAGPGRGRVRLRVPLPQPGGGRGDERAGDLPVGRDGGHAGGDARARARWGS
jgi:hypothetical protein